LHRPWCTPACRKTCEPLGWRNWWFASSLSSPSAFGFRISDSETNPRLSRFHRNALRFGVHRDEYIHSVDAPISRNRLVAVPPRTHHPYHHVCRDSRATRKNVSALRGDEHVDEVVCGCRLKSRLTLSCRLHASLVHETETVFRRKCVRERTTCSFSPGDSDRGPLCRQRHISLMQENPEQQGVFGVFAASMPWKC